MEISFFNQLILGLIQGVFEWLPISSSAFFSLFANNFMKINSLEELVRLSLLFHLGTFLAALVYFRTEVRKLFETLFKYKKQTKENQKVFSFILVSFIISGIIGFIILKFIETSSISAKITGAVINLVIAFLLLITAIIGFISKTRGNKKEIHLKKSDGIILGLSQGIATIPGLSRSGVTTSALLLRKFDDTVSLKLSFLMSLPIVFVGNIILNLKYFAEGSFPIFGVAASFIFGLLTIHALIKFAKKVNFNWFLLVFGLLMLLSTFFL